MKPPNIQALIIHVLQFSWASMLGGIFRFWSVEPSALLQQRGGASVAPLPFWESCCEAMGPGCLAIFGQWRNGLESLKYSWPFFGYDQRQWTGSMLAADTQIRLTEIVRAVLCGCVPVILLYGLPHVKMVGTSQGTASIFPNPAKQLQAIILYPLRRRCSTFDNQLSDCLYYILGLVRTLRSYSSNVVQLKSRNVIQEQALRSISSKTFRIAQIPWLEGEMLTLKCA